MMREYSNQKPEQNERIDNESIKEQLISEVGPIQFTEDMKQAVLDKAQQPISIWEREITISIPVAAMTILLMLSVGVISMMPEKNIAPPNPTVHDTIVNISTGSFWESDILRGKK